MPKTDHFLLLVWLLTFGLVAFGFVVCYDTRLIQEMIETDRSMVCIVVIAMYAVGLGHSFWRTLHISSELNLVTRTGEILRHKEPDSEIAVTHEGVRLSSGTVLPESFVTRYVIDLFRTLKPEADASQQMESRADILEAYASRIRGANDFGWFLIDLMLKVGFLGTLIGFIMMLGAVSQQDLLDASMMQRVLKQMSFGMSTALNTTLVSLVGGILLSLPYYLLGRGLDDLLEDTIHLTEVQIWPRLVKNNPGG
ncbi:MAG: MotA/TolQ/ExbB proton channel family protein [Gammaproteobacteria bacterium]